MKSKNTYLVWSETTLERLKKPSYILILHFKNMVLTVQMQLNLLFKLKTSWDTLSMPKTQRNSRNQDTLSTLLCIWRLTKANSTSYLMKEFIPHLNSQMPSLVLSATRKRRRVVTELDCSAVLTRQAITFPQQM